MLQKKKTKNTLLGTEIEINEKFQEALDLMENTQKNVFITGKAGTGKSTLLNYFRQMTKKQIVVLSPTGVGAVNVGGETIHSFFKFKPDITEKKAKEIAKKVGRQGVKIFKTLEAIIIDEISMVRADLLDCMDVFLRTVLKNRLPFGGKQMIFIGDLYQLPPVTTGKDKEIFKLNYKSPYFFDAKVFPRISMEFIELEKIYRQSDPKFIELLNAIRNNTVSDSQIKLLNKRVNHNIDIENLDKGYVYLTSINRLAEQINKSQLEKINQKKYILQGEIKGEFDQKYLPTEINLEVKKGAQVMLLNNDSKGRWINGTIGWIKEIKKDKIIVSLENGKKVSVQPFQWEIFETFFNKKTNSLDKKILGSFLQYPIKLAWALTIHKSQGKTFNKIIIDTSGGIFAPGQIYVALSRATTLEGIILKNKIKKSAIFTDWRIVKFLTQYQYKLGEKRTPLKKKIKLIKEAIENKNKLEIVYLKTCDQKTKRVILPIKVGEMEYCQKRYLGVEAYCFLRKEKRTFRIDRILEIKLL